MSERYCNAEFKQAQLMRHYTA